MTVLGAVVFGGLLALGVLWLLATAPGSDVAYAWTETDPAGEVGSAPAPVLAHSLQ